MIRVAYLCEFSTLLGGERSLLTFLDASRGSIEPIVVCPESGDFVRALDRLVIPHIAWTRASKKDDLAVFEQIRGEGFAIIHGNSLSMAEVVWQAMERTGLPGVLHIRDIAKLSQRRWQTIKRIDRIIGVSLAVCRWLASEGIEESRLHHIYNGVGFDMGTRGLPVPTKEELGLPSNKRLIACIGQICLRKGQDVFLRACQRVASRIEDVDFLIIGERYSTKEESIAYERKLHDWSESPELSGRVQFLGYRHDVREITAQLDLVAVTSRQEPLSRVLIESLAAGVPCVASKVGGNAEIITDGRFGRLFTSDDDEDLARRMIEMLRDVELKERTMRDGPAFIRENFSADHQVARIRQVYQSLLSQ